MKTENKAKLLLWRFCCFAIVVLSVLTFTPLIIPAGTFEPSLFGVPFTLWAGMLIALAMIILTIIASIVHPDKYDNVNETE
ncbi:MAG: hypothetical protein GKR93_18130 [Gammaproteobacteria bacterium]|nr:hypothetical protein [Gammaproteobacteria bacterium]